MKAFTVATPVATPVPIAALLAALLAVAPAPPARAQDFSDVEIVTTPLSGDVAMLTGAGGNIGVCHGVDGALLVDTEFGPLTDRIVAAVAALDEHPVRWVVDTHWHSDHVGGNENLARMGALIAAHENVRKRMATEQEIVSLGRKVPPSPAIALPALTFTDSLVYHLNGETIVVFHVPPAHTDGDAVVRFLGSDVLQTGDLFFNGLYPFIDDSAGGRLDGMIAAVRMLLPLCGEATRIIPGHGPLATRADLEAYLAMLEDVHARLAADIAAGKSLDEIKAGKPTAAWDDPWGKQWLDGDAFTEIAYRSMVGPVAAGGGDDR